MLIDHVSSNWLEVLEPLTNKIPAIALQPVRRLRSPIQYFGGKGNMRARILPLFPKHHTYCEPFGGGASMLFAKQPSPCEVYNDLDGTVVNLFRCLQDPELYRELEHRLRHTLYARMEFVRANDILGDPDASPVMRAWALFVSQNQGMSGIIDRKTFGDWGRKFKSYNGMAGNCNSWMMRLDMLPDWHRRLLHVQIDCNDAFKVIRYWDTPETLFYLDPPYVMSTRADKQQGYRCEMTDEQHGELVGLLQTLQGNVVLSGYPHPLYEALELAGWCRLEFETAVHAAVRTRNSGLQGAGRALAKVPRTECVWMNFRPMVDAVLAKQQISLFEVD